MTSLAKQLQLLALPQNQDNQACEASILFDKNTATQFDKDTVFALGVNGYRELSMICQQISSYESLFSEQAKDIDFRTQSKKYNEKLRKKIDSFLIEISPYFLLRPALKCLEWLIYRFRIQEFNVDGLLSCAFPYYSTNIFVRAVQTIDLNSNPKWSWLEDIQVNGTSPSRNNLISQCSKNSKFFHFICNLIKNAIEVAENKTIATCSQTITFFTSIMLGTLISSKKKEEVILQQLLPILTKGLKSQIKDYQASSFMIISQISINVNLSVELIDHFVKVASRNCLPSLQNEMIKFCLLLCQTTENISNKTLKRLKKLDGFQSFLVTHSSNIKFQHFLVNYLEFSISHLQDTEDDMETDNNELGDVDMICSIMMNPDFPEQMYKDVLKFVFSCLTKSDAGLEQISNLLQTIQENDSDKFYKTLKVLSQESDIGESWQEILSSKNRKFSKDSPSLLCISLYQRHAEVRINAVKNIGLLLDKQISTEEKQNHVVSNIINTFMLEDTPEVDTVLIELFLNKPELVFYNIEQVCDKLARIVLSNGGDLRIKEMVADLIFNSILTKKNEHNIPGAVENKMFFLMMSLLLNAGDLEFDLKLIQDSNYIKINFTKKIATELINCISENNFENVIFKLIALTSKYVAKKQKQNAEIFQNLLEIAKGENEKSSLEENLVYFIFLAAQIESETESDLMNVCSVLTPLVEDISDNNFPKSDFCSDFSLQNIFKSKTTMNLQQLVLGYTVKLISQVSMLSKKKKISKDNQIWRNLLLLIMKIKNANESSNLLEVFCEKNFASQNELLVFVCELICESYASENCAENFKEKCENQLDYCILRNYLLFNMKNEIENNIWPAMMSTLLFNLSSTISDLRIIALQCLKHITTLNNKSCATELSSFVIENKEELFADSDHIKKVLKEYFSEKSESKKVKKTVLTKRNAFFEQITKYVFEQNNFGSLFYEHCLSKVLNLKVLSGLHSIVEKVYQNIKSSLNAYTVQDSQLLKLFFSKLKSVAMSNSKISKLFLQIISVKSFSSNLKSIELPQFIAMGCITKPFVAALNDDLKSRIYEIVLEIGKSSHDTSVSHLLTKTFKVLPVQASLVCKEIKKFHTSLNELKDVDVVTKKLKLDESIGDETELKMDPMKGLIYLLENIQNKKNIVNSQLLVELLLDTLHKMEQKSLQDENVDYLVQLLLGCLLNLVKNKTCPSEVMTKELQKHLNVELLIRCIVASENTKIHQDTLLILAFSASFCPEKILHSVMSVFTFMGNTMLRRDDSYSFQVIKQIIHCLVPALLASKKYSGNEMVVKILQVFVDAISHIPAHRRSTIFGELLENVDSSTHLWQLIVLLIDKNINKSNNDDSNEDEKTESEDTEISFSSISDLCLCLCHLNKASIQIQCISSIIQYIDSLPLTQDGLKDLKRQTKASDQFGLIDFQSRSFLQLHKLYHALLKFTITLLSVSGPITSAFKLTEKEENVINESNTENTEVTSTLSHFQGLIQTLLFYNSHVHLTQLEVDNNNNETIKYQKLLQLKIAKLTEKVRTILPECYFLIVVINLLSNQNSQPIKKQVLILLTQRISSHPFNVCDEEVALLLQLSKILTNALIEQSNSKSQPSMCEATLQCLTRIFQVCKKSTNFDPTFVIPFLCDFIFNSISPGKQALTTVVSCLSEVCEILQNHCIPHLPKIVPCLIYLLRNNHATKTELLVVHVLASLQKLLISFNLFFKPYLVDILMEISLICHQNHFLSTIEPSNTNSTNSKLKTVVSSIFTILASKIPARIIIPTLQQSYEKANEKEAGLVAATQEVMVQTLNNLSKSELNLHSSMLYNFFLNTLMFRTQHTGTVELPVIEEIELRGVEGFVSMLLKFPEGLFHSLYTKFSDWGCSKDTTLTESITYYRCMTVLASKLKLLFTPLGGALLTRVGKTLEDFANYEEIDNTEQLSLLTQQCRYAVESCRLCLLHCNNTSFNKETYQTVIHPLSNQLDSKSAISGQIREYLNGFVIPCIGQLALTSQDTSVWQTLHYAVLLKTRHSSAKVRCYSMDAIAIIAKKLGNSYTTLLPETIPFLAELMEDGNEMVERKCQVIIKQIEEDIDENLQKYF